MRIKGQEYGSVSKGYTCPVCNKFFLVPYQSKGHGRTQWAYKKRTNGRNIYYCSYTCFHKQEKDGE